MSYRDAQSFSSLELFPRRFDILYLWFLRKSSVPQGHCAVYSYDLTKLPLLRRFTTAGGMILPASASPASACVKFVTSISMSTKDMCERANQSTSIYCPNTLSVVKIGAYLWCCSICRYQTRSIGMCWELPDFEVRVVP
jgi:hypothetical protein